MQYRILPAVITAFVIILGFLSKKERCSDIQNRINFIIEFLNNFIELIEHFFQYGDFNTEAYDKYMNDADAMQIELGFDGIMDVRDPLKNVQIRSYQLILNLIPELRSMSSLSQWNSIIRERENQMVGATEDALRRHMGYLKRIQKEEQKGLHNPIVCFAEGIRVILRIPGKVLVWLGIVDVGKEQKFYTSVLFKIIRCISTFVGFVSAVVTILLGWNQCVEVVMRLIREM